MRVPRFREVLDAFPATRLNVELKSEAAGAEKVYWLTQGSNAVARGLYDRVADSTGFVHYETRV